MIRNLMLATASIALLSTPALAAEKCRDAKGHFMKCPPKAAAPMTKKAPCRDAKGHFKKC